MYNIDHIIQTAKTSMQAIEMINKEIRLPQLTAQDRGDLAELGTLYLLRSLQDSFPKLPSCVFSNVLFKTQSKVGTTEIDSILLTPRAIFIIETKSYYGETTILNDKDHTFVTDIGKSVRKTTPVKQNLYHTRVLKRMLKGCYSSEKAFVPIVNVFSNGRLMDKRSEDKRELVPVTNLQYLSKIVYNVLSQQKVDLINFAGAYNIISKNNIYTEDNMLKHIEDVKAKGVNSTNAYSRCNPTVKRQIS